MRGEEIVTDKKIIVQFTILTFCIAYLVSGALIALGQFGYSVHNWVHSLQEFGMNIPFAVYILSPAIASYIVLKKNNKITNFFEHINGFKLPHYAFFYLKLGFSIVEVNKLIYVNSLVQLTYPYFDKMFPLLYLLVLRPS